MPFMNTSTIKLVIATIHTKGTKKSSVTKMWLPLIVLKVIANRKQCATKTKNIMIKLLA